MKKLSIILLLMSLLSHSFSQSVATPYPSIPQGPFEASRIPKEEDVEGSPLLFKDWRAGTVVLRNHTQYDNVRLNFAPSVNKFYFNLHDTSGELVNTVDEIRIKDLKHPDDRSYDVIFKDNINTNGAVKPGTFVEVLTNGKILLFKEYEKEAEGQNGTTGLITFLKKYVLHTNIFAIVDDSVRAVKLNARFLSGLTSDKQEQMKEFIKLRALNLKKETDFKLAISYYNYISSPAVSGKVPI